jgi:hypothetical protein
MEEGGEERGLYLVTTKKSLIFMQMNIGGGGGGWSIYIFSPGNVGIHSPRSISNFHILASLGIAEMKITQTSSLILLLFMAIHQFASKNIKYKIPSVNGH